MIAQQPTLDELETEIKDRLRTLAPIDAAAEMQIIQIDFEIACEEHPNWPEKQVKSHVYSNWLGNNPL